MANVEISFEVMVEDARRDISKLENSIDELGKTGKKSGISLTDLKSGLELVKDGAEIAKKAFDATVGVTVEYAKQVRDLSRAIGASTEETSMLIQAADDVGISFGTIQTAMEAAIRKGVNPSIDGMGRLADQYVSIQDPIERTKFLMDNFGRSGADLGPLMEKGSAGIRELGKDARATGLILSGEAVKAARDYEIALDGMQDAVKGTQYQLGKVLLPVAIEVTKIVGDAAQAFNDEIKIVQLLGIKFELATGQIDQHTAAQRAAAVAGETLNVTQTRALDLANEVLENYQKQNNLLPNFLKNKLSEQKAVDDSTQAEKNAKAANEALTQSKESAIFVWDAATTAVNNSNLSLGEQKALLEALALASGATTKEEIAQTAAVSNLTAMYASGKITQQEYVDLVARLASSAISAADAVSILQTKISQLKDKDVYLRMHYIQYGSEDFGGAGDNYVEPPGTGETGAVGGKKAGGGPTLPGQGYIVGEHGPEWFSPSVPGNISNIWNVNISSAQSTGSLSADLTLARIMAGA